MIPRWRAIALAVMAAIGLAVPTAQTVLATDQPDPETATSEVTEPSVDTSVTDSSVVTDSTAPEQETPKKVYVCKYVGTPHVDEQLQTGQNPISVSVNSIKGFTGTLPFWFADEHDRSVAIAWVVKGQPEPSVSQCPAPETPPSTTTSTSSSTTSTTETPTTSSTTLPPDTSSSTSTVITVVEEPTTSTEAPVNVPLCTSNRTVVVDSVSDFIYNDIRSAGHIEFADFYAHLFTDDATSQAKVAGYVAADGWGADSIDWSGSSPAPGTQLGLSGGGFLVGESVYGNQLWLSNSAPDSTKAVAPHTGGGYGSNYYGTIQEWANALTKIGVSPTIMGFSLGSGVHGDGQLTSVTAGCVKMTFRAPVTEVPPTTTEPPTTTTPVTEPPAPTDPTTTAPAPTEPPVVSSTSPIDVTPIPVADIGTPPEPPTPSAPAVVTELPTTGSSSPLLAALALLFVGAGAGIVVIARRRRPS